MKQIVIIRATFELILAVALSACVPTDQTLPTETISAGTVVHASAEDCEIIVEVGKAKLNWGTAAPVYAFFPEFDLPGGRVYREDCHWKELGLAEPVIGSPSSQKGFFISRPAYSGTRATVELEMTVRPPEGQRIGAFIEADICTLEKRVGHWRLMECRLKFIT
jgi:hypothetical protein